MLAVSERVVGGGAEATQESGLGQHPVTVAAQVAAAQQAGGNDWEDDEGEEDGGEAGVGGLPATPCGSIPGGGHWQITGPASAGSQKVRRGGVESREAHRVTVIP